MNIVNAGARYQVYGEDVQTYKELPVATYTIGYHPQMGFWLVKHTNLEINEERIYGSHSRRVDKIFKSFDISDRNFGVILSGKKGIGKSLLARMIADRAIERGLPVIIVDTAIPGISNFLGSIDQEVVIIFDEFEKTFARIGSDNPDPQVEMLSLFDGTDNGKKLFIITCNDTRKLNEFLINRPGRFHYHFEIGCPTSQEVRAYLEDKLGGNYQEEIEKVVKLAQMADITYDSLRAIAFDLRQGYPLEETLLDLNINYERDTYFDITVRLTNGWALTTYNKKIDLYSREDEVVVFYKNDIGGRIFLRFNPNKIRLVNNVLTLKGIDASVECDWDCWDDKMSDEDAAKERKNFNDNVRVESATFTKVMTYNVSKYVDV